MKVWKFVKKEDGGRMVAIVRSYPKRLITSDLGSLK